MRIGSLRQSLTSVYVTPGASLHWSRELKDTKPSLISRFSATDNKQYQPSFIKTIWNYYKPKQLPVIEPDAVARFAQHDTVNLDLDLYLPKGKSSTPVPVIMLLYGSAHLFGNKNCSHAKIVANGLTKQGYAVAVMDYRKITHTHFSPYKGCLKRWMDGNIKYCTDDANQALHWLIENSSTHNLDANKIGLLGFSAGSLIASITAAENPQLVKAICNYYGAYNQQRMGGLLGKLATIGIYGLSISEEEKTRYNAMKNLFHGPELLIHGTDDELCSFQMSIDLALERNKLGLETYLCLERGLDHGFMNFPVTDMPENQRQIDRVVDFFNEHL